MSQWTQTKTDAKDDDGLTEEQSYHSNSILSRNSPTRDCLWPVGQTPSTKIDTAARIKDSEPQPTDSNSTSEICNNLHQEKQISKFNCDRNTSSENAFLSNSNKGTWSLYDESSDVGEKTKSVMLPRLSTNHDIVSTTVSEEAKKDASEKDERNIDKTLKDTFDSAREPLMYDQDFDDDLQYALALSVETYFTEMEACSDEISNMELGSQMPNFHGLGSSSTANMDSQVATSSILSSDVSGLDSSEQPLPYTNFDFDPTASHLNTPLEVIAPVLNLCISSEHDSSINFYFQAEKGTNVSQVKALISDQMNTPSQRQKLLYNGIELEEGYTLEHFRILDNSILLLSVLQDELAQYLNLFGNSFSPEFDHDFTNIDDTGKIFMRGNEKYVRPCGWMRYALNVKGKFENDIWLGAPGYREDSSSGEWPVTYHGTSIDAAREIADTGYLLSRGVRFKHGHGIYTTPNIKVAEAYAKIFSFNGKSYMILLQNRVSPTSVKKTFDSHVVKHAEYWVCPVESDVRPYGILIREVT